MKKLFILIITLIAIFTITLSAKVGAETCVEFEGEYGQETEEWYSYDDDLEDFALFSKYEYTYNEDGNMTLEKSYWPDEDGTLIYGMKTVYTYNQNKKITSLITYDLETEEKKTYEEIYEYDLQNNVTLLLKIYYKEDGSVSSKDKHTYTYENGLLKTDTSYYFYNGKDPEFSKELYSVYEYDNNKLMTKCTCSFYKQDSTYNNGYEFIWEYNDKGQVTLEEYYEFDLEDKSDAYKKTYEVYTYESTEKGLKISSIGYSTNDGGKNYYESLKSSSIDSDTYKFNKHDGSIDGDHWFNSTWKEYTATLDAKGRIIRIDEYDIELKKDGESEEEKEVKELQYYTLYKYPVEKEEPKEDKKQEQVVAEPEEKNNTGLIIGICVGVVVLLTVGSYVGWSLEIKKKGQEAERILKFFDKAYSKISDSLHKE